MKRNILPLIFSLVSFFISAQDPVQIIQKALDQQNGRTNQGETEMTIVRPRYTRTMTMKSWSYGNEMFMILITGPARDKGQVFLKRNNDMWNWIPNISRMIKIPPSMMGQNWMGSDFTNDDLVKMNSLVVDYSHKLLGEDTIENMDCYIIELRPKPDAAVVWGKIKLWVSKEEYLQLKGEYYDEDGVMVNTMEASEIKPFGDRRLPAKMVMTPVNKDGQQTILYNKSILFDVDISPNFFSQQNMKRVK